MRLFKIQLSYAILYLVSKYYIAFNKDICSMIFLSNVYVSAQPIHLGMGWIRIARVWLQNTYISRKKVRVLHHSVKTVYLDTLGAIQTAYSKVCSKMKGQPNKQESRRAAQTNVRHFGLDFGINFFYSICLPVPSFGNRLGIPLSYFHCSQL